MESVCSALSPGTCWLKVPWPIAGLLSVTASDYHFSTTPELCSAALGLAGRGAQSPEPALFCMSSSIFYIKGTSGL